MVYHRFLGGAGGRVLRKNEKRGKGKEEEKKRRKKKRKRRRKTAVLLRCLESFYFLSVHSPERSEASF